MIEHGENSSERRYPGKDYAQSPQHISADLHTIYHRSRDTLREYICEATRSIKPWGNVSRLTSKPGHQSHDLLFHGVSSPHICQAYSRFE